MNRRHFLMSSAGVLAAARRATPSPNDTVRVAVVGLHGRGKDHLKEYARLANVEVAALCDVDESVLNKAAGQMQKRPATFTDLRKLLEDKSIDAISIATPNHRHAMQTIWGCQAGKDVYVEKPCAHNMFEANKLWLPRRKYDRLVQQGRPKPFVAGNPRGRPEDGNDGTSAMFTWRAAYVSNGANTIGRTPLEPVPEGVALRTVAGSGAEHASSPRTVSTTTGTGSGITATAIWGTRACMRWTSRAGALGVKYPTKVAAMGGHFMFDDDQETPNTHESRYLEFDEGGKKKMMEFDVAIG